MAIDKTLQITLSEDTYFDLVKMSAEIRMDVNDYIENLLVSHVLEESQNVNAGWPNKLKNKEGRVILSGNTVFLYMAKVISVSIPDALYDRWQDSDKDISPSAIFQSALETELDQSNRMMIYWSSRALNAEKKLRIISDLVKANNEDVKKFLLFESNR